MDLSSFWPITFCQTEFVTAKDLAAKWPPLRVIFLVCPTTSTKRGPPSWRETKVPAIELSFWLKNVYIKQQNLFRFQLNLLGLELETSVPKRKKYMILNYFGTRKTFLLRVWTKIWNLRILFLQSSLIQGPLNSLFSDKILSCCRTKCQSQDTLNRNSPKKSPE